MRLSLPGASAFPARSGRQRRRDQTGGVLPRHRLPDGRDGLALVRGYLPGLVLPDVPHAVRGRRVRTRVVRAALSSPVPCRPLQPEPCGPEPCGHGPESREAELLLAAAVARQSSEGPAELRVQRVVDRRGRVGCPRCPVPAAWRESGTCTAGGGGRRRCARTVPTTPPPFGCGRRSALAVRRECRPARSWTGARAQVPARGIAPPPAGRSPPPCPGRHAAGPRGAGGRSSRPARRTAAPAGACWRPPASCR